ncbi:hypothetical protein BKA67DRAFT_536223 [Truncatella angustata]|uniref:Uncharacterized protein n=1 Tax=Truncatella angustata TaxID=152316 RepID=A0A9P8UI21_9PEZI|nr:uncharacterized protein BKA67DRAFT_536223 [Truncatella angustata]KAH6652484.1 hypothetical protein BKA67DRAFT_536223 [Truncatella angustata]KAH8195572.1 hypothetical protein TruAng_010254 [Truncatella angustata]
MDAAAAKHVGARILGEVEEESLEDLLNRLRDSILPPSQGHPPLNPQIPITSLSTLISKHHHANQSAPPPVLSLSGRYLPFLYHLTSTLIAAPHRHAIVIVDVDHRFDVTRLIAPSADRNLPARPGDLAHIYIYRPARSSPHSAATGDPPHNQTQAAISAAQQHMLYGAHASRGRVWWGTLVVGGSGGDVNAGWRGWMDVQREEVAPFGLGVSAEEALEERDKRYERVRERGWEGRSRVGVYSWGQGNA